jgi:hypothetical protein
MKTTAEIISWLKSASHIRNILVEVQGVNIGGGSTATFYLSTKPFVSANSDTPSNTSYDSCLVGGVSFSESLSLDGSVSIGFGDLEVDNTDGSKDAWLNYIWTNRSVNIRIGDPTWPHSDYRVIFSGLISDIASRDRSRINLVLVDKLQKLNNPISEALLTNPGLDSDEIIPVCFGECFNLTPLASNPATLEYQVHTGSIEDIIEVRDNGAPVAFTESLSTGKFTLNQAPFGQITCSVQGALDGVSYYNTIPNIIKLIVKSYGPVATRLTDADIDLVNFSNFNILYPSPVGVYCTSRENMLDICNQLASSIGAQVTFTPTGLLKLVRLDMSGTGVEHTIQPEDIELQSLSVQEKAPVRGTTKLGYCKNWTVQTSGLAAGINPSSVNLFNTEYLFSSTTNATTTANYSLSTEPEAEPTLLITAAGANTESTRRNNLFSQARVVYGMVAYSHLLFVELGDNIRLTNSRFGLNNTAGIVVSIDRDWITGRVTLGVLV